MVKREAPALFSEGRSAAEVYEEGVRLFMGRGELNQPLSGLVRDLNHQGIDYMVIDAVALIAHGYRRFTEDIDLVMSPEDLETSHREPIGLGYAPQFRGARKGKSTLCAYLACHVCQPWAVPYGIVDFDRPHQPEPHEVLLDLRHQLVSTSLKFDCFDCVWARFLQVTLHPNLVASHVSPLISIPSKIIQAFTNVDLLALVDVVTENWPAASHWLSEQYGDGWPARLKNMKRDEVVQVMPDAFAEDLERSMREAHFRGRDGNKRITLFFDGIDCAVDDYIVERLCELAQSFLVVICGRRLSEALEVVLPHERIRQLQNFSESETVSYLKERDIADLDLTQRLYSVTDGFPGFLALCVDECDRFQQKNGHMPDPSHFIDTARNKFVDRIVRDLGGDALDAIRLASVPRWFTREILQELTGDGLRALRFFQSITPSELCRPQSNPPGAYAVISDARRSLHSQIQRLPELRRWHETLRQYHADRALSTDPLAFAHQLEMVYHTLFLDKEQGITLFDEIFQECLRNHYLARCNSLMEAANEWARVVGTLLADEDEIWLGEYSGHLLLCQAELRYAEERWDEAYDLVLSAIGYLSDAPMTLTLRALTTLCHAGLRYEHGEHVLRKLEDALENARATNDQELKAELLKLMSDIHAHNLDWETASECLDEAASLLRAADNAKKLCEVLLAAARHSLAAGIGTRAWEFLREASSVATESVSTQLQVDVLLAKAHFAETWRDWYGALWSCQQALNMLGNLNQSLSRAKVLLHYARTIRESQKSEIIWGRQQITRRRLLKQNVAPLPNPLVCYGCAIGIYSQMQKLGLEGQARVELAVHLWETGMQETAIDELQHAMEIFESLGARANYRTADGLMHNLLCEAKDSIREGEQ